MSAIPRTSSVFPSNTLQGASIQKPESPLQAYWYTISPHIKDALLSSVTGIFFRIFSLPNSFRIVFSSPLKYLDVHEERAFSRLDHHSLELTHTSINERADPMHWNNGRGAHLIPPKEKLHYIINRAHELAERLGITKELKIFPTPTPFPNGLGTSFSTETILLVDRKTASSSQDVIDFILAHELAHIAHNHILKQESLKTAFLGLDILPALIFGSPLALSAIPLCEALAAPLERLAHRMQEKDADLTAMTILNTNRGAIEYLTNRITEHKNLRDLTDTPTDPTEISMRKCFLSPEGNNRLDLDHPQLTKRLAFAQAFQPQADDAKGPVKGKDPSDADPFDKVEKNIL